MSAHGAGTRIIATVGPSLRTADGFTAAIRAGAGGFRIPLSRQLNRAVDLCHTIADVADRLDVDISMYLDVPGPKKILMVPHADVGGFKDVRVPFVFRTGATNPYPDDIHLMCDAPSGYFEVGDEVLLGDGEAALTVVDSATDWVVLRTPAGGLPAGQLGVAVSGKEGHLKGNPLLSVQAAEVIRQIPYAKVMLSFVETDQQIRQAREALARLSNGSENFQLWSKVETRKGVDNAAAIAGASDGVLLGRGDLLIDTGYLEYFVHERRAREVLLGGATPLMLGTQLWTASSSTYLPHRSELSYLCDWIAGGVDSVLLSDETTVGTDPSQAIAAIRALVKRYGPD